MTKYVNISEIYFLSHDYTFDRGSRMLKYKREKNNIYKWFKMRNDIWMPFKIENLQPILFRWIEAVDDTQIIKIPIFLGQY
jgi:hypothetical protein